MTLDSHVQPQLEPLVKGSYRAGRFYVHWCCLRAPCPARVEYTTNNRDTREGHLGKAWIHANVELMLV